ncbi:MAG: hypothetical protein Q7S79_00385, partial [bacterium]|nr:hypothetical protein [bacterium]
REDNNTTIDVALEMDHYGEMLVEIPGDGVDEFVTLSLAGKLVQVGLQGHNHDGELVLASAVFSIDKSPNVCRDLVELGLQYQSSIRYGDRMSAA